MDIFLGQSTYLVLFVLLMVIGYVAGRASERRHYRSIFRREQELKSVLVFSARTLPPTIAVEASELVVGDVVISIDYFKKFVAGLRNLTGGRMMAYETLLDRARREAVLRMKQRAHDKGADMIFNVKLETVPLGSSFGSGVKAIEMYAYGTAVKQTDMTYGDRRRAD